MEIQCFVKRILKHSRYLADMVLRISVPWLENCIPPQINTVVHQVVQRMLGKKSISSQLFCCLLSLKNITSKVTKQLENLYIYITLSMSSIKLRILSKINVFFPESSDLLQALTLLEPQCRLENFRQLMVSSLQRSRSISILSASDFYLIHI